MAWHKMRAPRRAMRGRSVASHLLPRCHDRLLHSARSLYITRACARLRGALVARRVLGGVRVLTLRCLPALAQGGLATRCNAPVGSLRERLAFRSVGGRLHPLVLLREMLFVLEDPVR